MTKLNLRKNKLSLRTYSGIRLDPDAPEYDEKQITPAVIRYALSNFGSKTAEVLATFIIKLMMSTGARLGVLNDPTWQVFYDETIDHILSYSLPNFDPGRGATFTTFISNHVKNMWLNWIRKATYKKIHKELNVNNFIDESVGEGTFLDSFESPGGTPEDLLEASDMVNELISNISNPRYKDIARWWIAAGGVATTEETDQIFLDDFHANLDVDNNDIATIVTRLHNNKYCNKNAEKSCNPITPYRTYRIIHDIVKPLAEKLWPQLFRKHKVDTQKLDTSITDENPLQLEKSPSKYKVENNEDNALLPTWMQEDDEQRTIESIRVLQLKPVKRASGNSLVFNALIQWWGQQLNESH